MWACILQSNHLWVSCHSKMALNLLICTLFYVTFDLSSVFVADSYFLNISNLLLLLLLVRLVTQIIQFAEWSQQFSSSLLLFHAAAGVVICHQAISGSSGWWKLGSPAVYGLQSGLLCDRYRVVTVLASLSYTYVSSAGYVPYEDAELWLALLGQVCGSCQGSS